jgi:uncharacterized protein (DUF1015 family)
MAVVSAFPGLRYDPARVGSLAAVVAPPYDVISPAEQAALYARSPYNAVRLILPREGDRAAAAARTLREWIEARVLVADAEAALYLYSQRFTVPDGRALVRDGVICRLRLEEFTTGIVRPHERTFPGPKADRLALMRATGAYLSPIFGLFARPAGPLRDLFGPLDAPALDVTDPTGCGHVLWRVTDRAAIDRFREALAPETIYIADGHHRYETGLAYRDELGGAGASAWIMACLVNMAEDGLVILPTHRLLRAPRHLDSAALAGVLEGAFVVEPLDATGARPAGAIDLVLPDHRLRLRPTAGATTRLAHLPPVIRRLDVAVLRDALLVPLRIRPDELAFTHDDAEAVRAVASGEATAAFLVNPPSMETVCAVSHAGEVMPEKSTYFYPKLADGLVMDLVGPPWR